MNRRISIWLPLIIAVALVMGIFLGAYLPKSGPVDGVLPIRSITGHYDKLSQILRYIQSEYVDTVDMDELMDESIVNLLSELDPHCYYIPADELAATSEPLEGNFEGIGIEFNIQEDTIVVVAPISGGPSDLLGILPGDRIVDIEGKKAAGVGITNQDVMDKLRGEGGTKVSVKIYRHGHKDLLPFTITRGEIPLYSVDVAFMVNANTGYIKISRFARNTYDEFIEAVDKLKPQGMKQLILDLRGNPGGYLDAATLICDEFLSRDKLIVYTEGKARPRTPYFATARGSFEKQPLIILIDEGSASASEIVAGAVQDNDRGTIIGRTSFGKGLVQEESRFPDGSAIRLTIARYYTPTGRCIQRPYNKGIKAYYEDLYSRSDIHGGGQDSIPASDTTQKFTTPGGKVVYGGGGIRPDIFIPVDTAGYSSYLNKLITEGVINQFCFHYADVHRKELEKNYTAETFKLNFQVTGAVKDEFIRYTTEKGVPYNGTGWEESGQWISLRVKAGIGRQIWREMGFYPVLLEDDPVFLKARELSTETIN
ncbi:MAG: S41 family peptidase [Flavobacteriales bacterium]|nr:S41 family peptidase [Flavobacteriales bacterium]MCB9446711.1 S41 family peptidase [Flavobacteriales bacterium]